MNPPMLYFDTSAGIGGTWTTRPIPGAQTWQHKSMAGYKAWKRAQANMAARKAAAEREKSQGASKKWTPLELLQLLLAAPERKRQDSHLLFKGRRRG
jgi:hypothetical protein